MAISLYPQPYPLSERKAPKSLFVDASNRTKLHAHLRTSSMSSLRKSPPTCTLSLANVSSIPGISMDSIPIPFPAPSLCVPFPSNDADVEAGSYGEDSPTSLPQPWKRPRARTSHVETPRRAQPPPKAVRRNSKQLGSGTTPRPMPAQRRLTSSVAAAVAADLRCAALIERSITQRLRERPATPDSDAQIEFDRQDALLASRLRSTLAQHGRRVRPASPTGIGIVIAPPVCAPSVLMSSGSELFVGSTGVVHSSPSLAQAQAQAPAPLRFIPGRARSGSRGSLGGGSATLGMPVLVVSLMLRRHERGRPSSPSTFALTRVERSMTPSPLRANVHFSS
ncbi:hypothetical protein C8F04DRAFT_1115734 [Mycena alexandri]|uniref:Uncharacterized protein n=1 Tax=Mycena alexandri TaxID=1745969 RepID=A0AAD6SMN5_9AGAR|nr:hypothetical protein C8F04DRAFT_1115734 [Mycena alexandri]